MDAGFADGRYSRIAVTNMRQPKVAAPLGDPGMLSRENLKKSLKEVKNKRKRNSSGDEIANLNFFYD